MEKANIGNLSLLAMAEGAGKAKAFDVTKVIDAFVRHRLSRRDMAESYAQVFDQVFSLLLNRKEPKPEPLAYNAPVFGVQAPPFLQLR